MGRGGAALCRAAALPWRAGPEGRRSPGISGAVARPGRRGRGRRRALTRGAAKSERERRESAALGRELGWLLGRARPTREGKGGRGGPRGRERERGEWAGVAHAGQRKGKGRAGLGQGVWVAFFPSFFSFSFLFSNIQTKLFEFT
jgi:hypothetical protein